VANLSVPGQPGIGRTTGPSVLGWLLPHVIAQVTAQGLDATPIRQLPGLRQRNLDDPDLRVPESVAQEAWRLAARMTGDAALGLHVAESLPRGALDLVEYAFRSSTSLASGLGRLARYSRVLSDRVAARTEAHGRDLLLLMGDVGDGPLHPARTELSLAVALRLARDATGVDIRPLRVSFAHEAPRDQSDHERFFRGPVFFDSGSNSMVLRGDDAERPLRGADPALAAIVRRRLDKALAEREQPDGGSLAIRVRRMMLEELGQRALTPADVALRLDISTRTLSRRLADEQTSFRHILDEARCQIATALLNDRSLSVGDIAFFLQYSEPAAFHRSFKRWTGRTPRAFRESAPTFTRT
jgi:AraC-like DNA-binding protein